MTTISQALNTLSLGLAELSEALEGSELPPLPVLPKAIDGPVAASPAAAPAPTARESVLGECPVHFTPWELKEAGVSNKTGKPYAAFWKCNGKNADGSYCQKKPSLEWVRTHDPEQVPF